MAEFRIIEKQGLKMVSATIANESIRAEAGALHYLIGQIELESKMPTAGGFLKSLVTSESVFKPTYTGTGTVYFGPPNFGDYMVLDLKNETWVLDRGAYVCSDFSVEIGMFSNKAIAGLLSGEGMFQTKVSGTGKVVVAAHGPIEAIDLQNGRLVVDGSFAVARQGHLDFAVQRAAKGGLLGSAASGEGLVSVIQGTGRVYISPVPNLHNTLVSQIHSLIPVPKG